MKECMMKRLVVVGLACGAMAASAMPTRKELTAAQEMVTDVTSADMRALKAGTKNPSEVAALHMELAGKARSEAEKYLLLQGAFSLYAKAGDYDEAADALEAMVRDIPDMRPDVIVEIYNKAIFKSMKDKAPRLYAIREAARRAAANRKRLPALEKAVSVKPQDVTAQKALGECQAELGNWEVALAAFAKADGKVSQMAKAERDATAKPQELADFWWDYKEEGNAYRIHAVSFYREALEDEGFTGLARERAERRIKEIEANGVASVEVLAVESKNPVAAGARKATAAMAAGKPLSFEIGKDVKLELVHCPAGTFQMSNAPGGPKGDGRHEVKLTRAYWIAPMRVTSEMYKMCDASYDKEGKSKPSDLVAGRANAEAFADWLNKKFKAKLPRGYVFRMPTEAEWECAQQAGAIGKSWDFEGMLDTVKAIAKKAHSWKFELSVMDYGASEVDPVRVCTQNPAWVCRQNDVKRFLVPISRGDVTFRMVVGPNLLSEKKK